MLSPFYEISGIEAMVALRVNKGDHSGVEWVLMLLDKHTWIGSGSLMEQQNRLNL
jgi:hypothetical protein